VSDESPARASARRPALSPVAGPYVAFDGETLNEAIAEVSRQIGWRFELADPSLGETRVGGYVHADPEAFIELLAASLDLEARREGESHGVIRRRVPA